MLNRLFLAAAACAVVVLCAPSAKAEAPAGRWKLRIPLESQTVTFLLAFSETEGKWAGDFIGSSSPLNKEPKFTAFAVEKEAIRFTLGIAGREFINFDGVISKDGKKITGSISQPGGVLKLTDLYPSQLKKLTDANELAREDVGQLEGGQELFTAGYAVLTQATAGKIPIEEIRGIADKLAKVASGYGARWERTVALKVANILADQTGYTDVALAQAKRAERMLSDDSPTVLQLEVFDALARVSTKAGKPDDAKKYNGMSQKLEAKDYADFQKTALGFPMEAFKGRKGKSDRVVVFEIFTGSEAAPAAAAELAGQALSKTFPPTDVIVLQYHLPAPIADALMCQDGLERIATYAELIRTVPVTLINGKPGPKSGGTVAAAKDVYAEFREAAEKTLELPSTVKIKLTVTPAEKDKGFVAKAIVSDLEKPGEKIFLRFVLAEERIRFDGQSGVRYHHMVVRAMPGKATGFPLLKAMHEQTVPINPADLKDKISKFLDDFAKNESEFPRAERPLALTGLKLIALVQNETTGEILQATQVDLK